MEYGAHRMFSEDGQRIVPSVPLVDYDRLIEFLRQFKVLFKCRGLRRLERLVLDFEFYRSERGRLQGRTDDVLFFCAAWEIMVIETGLADRHDFGLASQAPQLGDKIRLINLYVVGMNPCRGVDLPVLRRQRQDAPGRFQIGADRDDPTHFVLGGPGEHRVEIAGEFMSIEVRVRVDEHVTSNDDGFLPRRGG